MIIITTILALTFPDKVGMLDRNGEWRWMYYYDAVQWHADVEDACGYPVGEHDCADPWYWVIPSAVEGNNGEVLVKWDGWKVFPHWWPFHPNQQVVPPPSDPGAPCERWVTCLDTDP